MATILLVDDDESLWLLQLVFERSGHHMLLADSGEPALVMAGRYLPDLIFTDWNMPGMDGMELCKRLKFHPTSP
jgi:CheY-like chemotaxis protein